MRLRALSQPICRLFFKPGVVLMDRIATFETMLARGQDSALLRYGLGQAYLEAEDMSRATEHLAEAVKQDGNYSAAWKLYGKALSACQREDEAIVAYDRGIAVAEARGDIQAAKEMTVFRKRLLKKRT